MIDLEKLHERLRARPVDEVVNLAGYDPTETPFVDNKSDAEHELHNELHEALFDQHELLYAQDDRSVLLLLQGIDCSGKNGTIKHVVISMNPVAVRTASFKKPTEAEADEHFLARHRRELPRKGELGVFDRSYYEDLIVPRVVDAMPDDEWQQRVVEVNDFEQELIDSGTTLIKCMLHISFDEQRDRFLRRLRRDDKRWKFSESDVGTRTMWNEFQASYGQALGATSTDAAPWFVIPADHKWYRNWVIAQLLLGTFGSMGLAYPQPDLDLVDLRERLAPPN